MMKHIERHIATILFLLLTQFSYGWAQNDNPQHLVETAGDSTGMVFTADSLASRPLPLAGQVAQDALDVCPPLALSLGNPWGLGGYGLGGLSPYTGAFDGATWRLHEGFNAQFGLSVSAGIGRHAMKGVGFGQNAAFAYVTRLTPKLSIAAGLFATNLDWGSWRRTDVGIGGVAAYEVNDKVNLYVYGQKSFMPQAHDFKFRRDPFPLFLEQQRDRIGAAAEFKIGQNTMIGVSVERSSY